MSKLSTEELRLLTELADSHTRGAFAVACDGSQRAPAHSLDKKGLARWHGTNWGSSFWAITDDGLAHIARATGEPA